MPKISWLIEGLLPSSGIGAIYGASGSSKSFLALDLALHIASKANWFGYEIKKNIPVYFIALEGQAGIKQRVYAWLKNYEVDEVENVDFLCDKPFLLNIKDDVNELIDLIKEKQKEQGIIIIDTFNQANIGVDENSAKEISPSLNNLKRISKETNSLVLFVHHSGKDESKGLRGSSSIRAVLDISIFVKANSKEITWEIDKSKDSRGQTKHSYKLKEIELKEDDELISSCIIEPNCKVYKKPPTGVNQTAVMEAFESLCNKSEINEVILGETNTLVDLEELIEQSKKLIKNTEKCYN